MKKIVLLLSWSLFLILCTTLLSAQNPVLDATFAKKGIRKVKCKNGFFARKLLLQSDGKIVAVGTMGNKRKNHKGNPETDFALFRFDANGRKDKSFGKKGKVVLDINNQSDQIGSAVLQSDGKIIVTGSTGKAGVGSFVVLRFLADGRLDPDFGEGGRKITKVGEGSNTGRDVLVQADGKIILIGHYYDGYDEDFVLLRYSANGETDLSFGKEGKVITDFDAHNDDAICGLLLSDNRILVGGTHEELGKAKNFALACYLPDGSLDKNFGSNGRASANRLNVTDEVLGVFEEPGGAISIIGRSTDRKDYTMALSFSRYTKAGLLDQRFFQKGWVEYKTGANTIFPSTVWKQASGNLLIGGGLRRAANASPGGLDFAIAQYQKDATLDTAFNGTGLVKTQVDKKSSFMSSMIGLEDGKALALGTNNSKKKKNKLILVRYAW